MLIILNTVIFSLCCPNIVLLLSYLYDILLLETANHILEFYTN